VNVIEVDENGSSTAVIVRSSLLRLPELCLRSHVAVAVQAVEAFAHVSVVIKSCLWHGILTEEARLLSVTVAVVLTPPVTIRVGERGKTTMIVMDHESGLYQSETRRVALLRIAIASIRPPSHLNAPG